MRLLAIAVFVLMAPLCSAADWRFGNMSIRWLDGYTKTPGDTPDRFVGPNGEVVMVTVMGLGDGGEPAQVANAYIAFGEREIPRLSSAKGSDVMKPRREDLTGGITLFSTAAVPKKDKKMFYLQFLAVSRTGRCALFTVEGHGDATTEMKRFRPLFDTISWTPKVGTSVGDRQSCPLHL